MKKTIYAVIMLVSWFALFVWLYAHATPTTIEDRYLITLVMWSLCSLRSLFQEYKK